MHRYKASHYVRAVIYPHRVLYITKRPILIVNKIIPVRPGYICRGNAHGIIIPVYQHGPVTVNGIAKNTRYLLLQVFFYRSWPWANHCIYGSGIGKQFIKFFFLRFYIFFKCSSYLFWRGAVGKIIGKQK